MRMEGDACDRDCIQGDLMSKSTAKKTFMGFLRLHFAVLKFNLLKSFSETCEKNSIEMIVVLEKVKYDKINVLLEENSLNLYGNFLSWQILKTGSNHSLSPAVRNQM